MYTTIGSVSVMSKFQELTGLKDMLGSLIKISDLTKYTSKILDDLNKHNKEVVIMKNNDPQGILLSIQLFNEVADRLKRTEELELEIHRLKEELDDLYLLSIAEQRINDLNPEDTLSRQELFDKFKIDADKIIKMSEIVEIE